VIVTTPHTPETEGMWHAQRFRRMKRTAHFINVGRGKTTRLDDLADALENGIIAGRGLDVFEVEPLPAAHRLWTLPNVLLTPHIAVRDAENPGAPFSVLFDNACAWRPASRCTWWIKLRGTEARGSHAGGARHCWRADGEVSRPALIRRLAHSQGHLSARMRCEQA
jgi:hypothetical protein